MAGLTQERFEELAEAWGGDIARWPAEAREAAARLMAAEPRFTGHVLARAEALDGALDAWRPAPARPWLVEAILAAAPQALKPRWISWLSPAALAGGLAAAAVAGVVAGVELSQQTEHAREMAVTNSLAAFAQTDDAEAGA